MLTRAEFDVYQPTEADVYANLPAELRLDDLLPAYEGPPKLSYLISTYNRSNQLSRSLECLARQEFREFEVLITDDGSTEDVASSVNKFTPYLQIRLFRMERETWHSCPSRAFKAMLPEARGEVIAIGHPEIMLHSRALGFAYPLAMGWDYPFPNTTYFVIDQYHITQGEWYWVSMKCLYLDARLYRQMDKVDWHSDVHALQTLPDFMDTGGFAGRPNSWHLVRAHYPWWFVGAAHRDCPLWWNMPTIDGHGIIDMWMCKYRAVHKIVDATYFEPLAYHQPHQTSAIAPVGEQEIHTI